MALEIQQSFNQMLSSAGIFAGLYAHQPNVQKRREAKQKLKEIGKEKEQVEKEKQVLAKPLSEELDPVVQEAFGRIQEGNGKEAIKLIETIQGSPLQTEYSRLEKREKTLAKQEEFYDPKLRIERMIERSEKAKSTTLQALKSYQEGELTLDQFKQKIGVKEPKKKKGDSK